MILTVTLNAAIDKRYVVDGFQTGEVNRVRSCVCTAGGKGLNVSRVAAIAGARVTATGFVGGYAGRYIEAELKPLHVKSEFFRLEAESRSCINIWDERACRQTELLEPGVTVAAEEFDAFEARYRKLMDHAYVIALSGSVPKGLDGSAYKRLVKIGKEAGKRVILDTSGELLREGIKAGPTMVKPNIDEIRMLTGKACKSQEELISAAMEIYESGVELVAVSLGADGSLLVCRSGIYRACVPKIEAVNTVGCGDSMIAGFALGISKGLTPEETLRRASAISAASALREETGFFLTEDMERLLPQITITKL